MMTEFSLHIRPRLGQRLGDSLDRLGPMISSGHARRGIAQRQNAGETTHTPGAVTALPGADMHMTVPHPHAATTSSNTPRGPQPANVSTAAPRAAQTPEQAARAPLHAQGPQPATVRPTAPVRPASQGTPLLRVVSDQDSAATPAQRGTGAHPNHPAPARAAMPDADPTESRQKADTSLTGVSPHGAQSTEHATSAPRGSHHLPTLLGQAIQRRHTMPATSPQMMAPVPTAAARAAAPAQAPFPLPGTAPMIAPVSATQASDNAHPAPRIGALNNTFQPRDITAIAALDRQFPRRTDPLGAADAKPKIATKTDLFAGEEQLRETLARILADDLRRHGIIPEGGL